MKEFILKTVNQAGDRITYTPCTEDDEELCLEDKYPVIATLWGKHGTCNIAITDVYLIKHNGGDPFIYADGIEQKMELRQEGFQIYWEQISDVLHFIMASFNEAKRIRG